MSHELRTPLNTVIGYSSSMLQMPQMYNNETLPEVYREDIEQIMASGQYLLGLINDVLDLSKIEAGRFEIVPSVVELPKLFEGVVATSVGLLSGKPLQVIPDYNDTLPLAWADAQRVRQILLNLMSNAIKFTNTGTITLFAHQKDDRIVIGVRDTGVGIPADALDTIFDRFEQVKHGETPSSGTGLGLDISSQLAKLHGSRIDIETKVGQGSTFSFSVAIATPEQIETADLTPSGAFARTEAKIFDATEPDREFMLKANMVLIVDHNEINRTKLLGILAGEEYFVVDAQSAKRGCELAEALLPDVIIVGSGLPDMDTETFVQKVRAAGEVQNRPIILVGSDWENVETHDDNIRYLHVPLEESKVVATIEEILQQLKPAEDDALS